MDSITRIFDLIKRERIYQDQKWGSIKENPHTIEEWIDIMNSGLRKARGHSLDVDSLGKIIQVTAVACACLEQYEDELKSL